MTPVRQGMAGGRGHGGSRPGTNISDVDSSRVAAASLSPQDELIPPSPMPPITEMNSNARRCDVEVDENEKIFDLVQSFFVIKKDAFPVTHTQLLST